MSTGSKMCCSHMFKIHFLLTQEQHSNFIHKSNKWNASAANYINKIQQRIEIVYMYIKDHICGLAWAWLGRGKSGLPSWGCYPHPDKQKKANGPRNEGKMHLKALKGTERAIFNCSIQFNILYWPRGEICSGLCQSAYPWKHQSNTCSPTQLQAYTCTQSTYWTAYCTTWAANITW